MKNIPLYTLLIFAFTFGKSNQSFAQLPSQTDNGQYAIAQMIASKAQQFKLGAIHSESPKMRPTAGKDGYFLRYEKGWVYYNPKLNKAFAIWGDIMKKWSEAGYETGWLGFPITDHTPTPNRSGFFVAFDNGSIYNNPQTGSHFVGGAFREEWARRGWENSADLGFPKTDEVEIFINGFTRYQQFEKGTLFWGANKSVVYTNNPNATTPPNDVMKELSFVSRSLGGFEPTTDIDGGEIELYGWMDLRVYKGNGQEISDADGKSFSVFNIQKKQPIDLMYQTPTFFKEAIRHYNISQSDIDGNAYLRITYWLNDKDISNSDDYLKLENYNGRWKYNGGDHPYREIKLKEIIRNGNDKEYLDIGSDGSDKVNIWYYLTIK
jgi:hypothetical protein